MGSPLSDFELQVLECTWMRACWDLTETVPLRKAAPDTAPSGKLDSEQSSKCLSPTKTPPSHKAGAGKGPPWARGGHPDGNAMPAACVAPESCTPLAQHARTSSARC